MVSQPHRTLRQPVDEPVHLRPKATHFTPLALDVLQERAQRLELLPAPVPRVRAPIDLIGVRRAPEVRIERGERGKSPVAEVALVRVPIPRAVGRPLVRDARDRAAGARNHPRGVRDDPAPVELPDELVDHGTRHARVARPGLEVQNERGGGDEGARAAFHGADDGALAVYGRVLVLAEVVRALEHALARHAVLVCMALPTVLVQVDFAGEHLHAR